MIPVKISQGFTVLRNCGIQNPLRAMENNLSQLSLQMDLGALSTRQREFIFSFLVQNSFSSTKIISTYSNILKMNKHILERAIP